MIKYAIESGRRIHYDSVDGRTISYCEFHSWIRQTFYFIR
jgi:hypothetical protein